MPKPLTLKQLFLMVLCPALIYSALFLMRPLWIEPVCSTHPEACLPDSVNGFDQMAFQYGSKFADFCSNLTQNGSGILAFLLPWVLLPPSRFSFRLNLSLLSITAWNGVVIELVRALVQRPRPLIFSAPLIEGQNINHYTSFYSGHTSFVTLALLFTVLWVRAFLPENKKTLWSLALLFPTLSLLTGILRVIGGRHYPTDIIGGLAFGTVISYGLSRYLLPRLR